MNKQKIQDLAHLTVTGFGIFFLSYIIFRYFLLAVLPFIIAWCSAMLLRPLSGRLSKRLRIPVRVIAPTLSVLLVGVGLFALIGFAVLLLGEIWEALSALLADDRLSDMLSAATEPISALLSDKGGADEVREYVDGAIKSALNRLSEWVVDLLSGIVRGVPKVLIFILVTVVSSVYFSMDIEKINARVYRILPKRWSAILARLKKRMGSVGKKYVKSYLILMLITFSVVLLGLLLLRVRNAFLISVIVALLDVLPLIGVGTVLLPWGVFSIMIGNVGRGIALLILLALHEVIRQIAEPRILGKNLGMHPLLSLMLIYIGYELFGFVGILLVPVLVVIIGMLGDKNDSSKVGKGIGGEHDGGHSE